jgi:hypothetical protein
LIYAFIYGVHLLVTVYNLKGGFFKLLKSYGLLKTYDEYCKWSTQTYWSNAEISSTCVARLKCRTNDSYARDKCQPAKHQQNFVDVEKFWSSEVA